MKKKRYSEKQIVCILREVDFDQSTGETNRKIGVYKQTIYSWCVKFEKLEISEVLKMRALEEDSRQQVSYTANTW